MGNILKSIGQIASFAIGKAIFGGPIGGAVVSTLYGLLTGPKQGDVTVGNEPSRLSDLMRTGSEMGTPIKVIYGTMPCQGEIILVGKDKQGNPAGIEEVVTTTVQTTKQGTFFRKRKTTSVTNSVAHYMTVGFQLGEGILYVDRMTFNDSTGSHVVYDRTPGANKITGATYTAANQAAMLALAATQGDAAIRTDDGNRLWVLTGTDPTTLGHWTQQLATSDGQGINLVPEYEAGELIAELSETVRFYPGTERQKVDTAVSTLYGTSANNMRGVAWVMFNKYPVKGNTTITFLVRNPITDAATIIEKRFEAAGVPASRVDTTGINYNVQGCAITQIQPVRDLIEKIAALNPGDPHDVLWINNAFRMSSRKNCTIWTLPVGRLGAHVAQKNMSEYPSKSQNKIKNNRKQITSLRLRFLDPKLQWEANEVVSQRNVASYENEETIEIPFAINFEDAIELVDTTHDEITIVDSTDTVTLMPEFCQIAEGNVLNYTDNDDIQRIIRIVEKEKSPLGMSTLHGVPWDQGVYGIHRIIPGTSGAPKPMVPIYDVPLYWMGEIVNTEEEDYNIIRVLVAVTNLPASAWSGAEMIPKTNGGFPAVSFGLRATMGRIVGAYNYVADERLRVRYDRTIRVDLDYGEFVSSTEDKVLNGGANRIVIGTVVLAFVTATPVDSNTWDLTGIIIGLLGSDYDKSLANNDKVLKLTDEDGILDPAIEVIEMPRSTLNAAHQFEIFAADKATKTTGTQSYTVLGTSVKPLMPLQPEAVDDGANIRISWSPATRIPNVGATFFRSGAWPLQSDPLTFELDLLKSDNVTYVTVAVTGTNVTKTYAEWTTLLGALPTDFDGFLYQTNGIVGRGHALPIVALPIET